MRYRFGDYEADAGRFALLRRGQPTAIEPKPLLLLLHLLEQHPNTVTKDELLDALWPDAAVTEGSLTRAVREVRRALRQHPDEDGVIRTVRGRGYGIGVEVEQVAEAAAAEPGGSAAPERVAAADSTPQPVAAPSAVSDAEATRRLATVLSADVASYSRLIAEDEAGTVAELQTAFRHMAVVVEAAGGRVVDIAGDNMLAEFPSAVAAVKAALAMQGLGEARDTTQCEEDPPAPSRLRFRIGLHLGEVLADGPRIYGNAVNIAARLESLAPVGGLAASSAVVESVRGRLRVDWVDAGETRLKNIVQPVRLHTYPATTSETPNAPLPFVPLSESGTGEDRMGSLARLLPLDRLLLGVGFPLWLVCYVLFIVSAVSGASFNPIGVTVWQASDEYPVVDIIRPITTDRVELEPGDRLLRLGEQDLRGVDALGFYARFLATAGTRGGVDLSFERDGVASTTWVPGLPISTFWPQLVLSPLFLWSGILLLLRSPRNTVARTAFHGALAFGIMMAGIFARPAEAIWASMFVLSAGACVFPALAVRFVLRFPHGRAPARWLEIATWLMVLTGPLHTSLIYGFPLPTSVGYPAGMMARAGTAGVILAALAITYRQGNPVERRQLKWIVWSAVASITPVVVMFGCAAFDPRLMPLAHASQIALAILPFGLFVAISRYDLIDIDRLLSTTASYYALLSLAVAALLLLTPAVSQGAAGLLGVSGEVGSVAVAVVLALLVPAAHAKLRPHLERAFFPARHAFDTGAEQLLRELSAASETRDVVEITARGIAAIATAQRSVLYGRRDDAFVPMIGPRDDLPWIPLDSALVAALRQADGPLILHSTAHADHRLDAFGRAVLESLGAEVVVPVSRGKTLELILCLGAKRSGDIYTPTDVALLSSIAHAASAGIERSGR